MFPTSTTDWIYDFGKQFCFQENTSFLYVQIYIDECNYKDICTMNSTCTNSIGSNRCCMLLNETEKYEDKYCLEVPGVGYKLHRQLLMLHAAEWNWEVWG